MENLKVKVKFCLGPLCNELLVFFNFDFVCTPVVFTKGVAKDLSIRMIANLNAALLLDQLSILVDSVVITDLVLASKEFLFFEGDHVVPIIFHADKNCHLSLLEAPHLPVGVKLTLALLD